MDWLNQNGVAVQAIATVVLVLITAYYAWATQQIVGEAQRSRRAAARPVLVFRLAGQRPTFVEFSLEIVNVGLGPAMDVSVELVERPALLDYYVEQPPQPFAIGAGASVAARFKVSTSRTTPNAWNEAELNPDFLEELTTFQSAGVLRASYRGVYEQALCSAARLEHVGNELDLRLGPIRLRLTELHP